MNQQLVHINITTTIINAINIQTYRDNSYTSSGSIATNTKVNINLSFVFSITSTTYSPLSVVVSDSGNVTLSWTNTIFPSNQQSVAIKTTQTLNDSITTSNLLLPWSKAIIPSIIF